jgi:predicted DNA-binding transcriptional regulator AlpA
MSATLNLSLPDELLDEIARRAAQLAAEQIATPATPERWLTADAAAEHLGISKSQLYTLTSQRQRNGLPVTKEGSRSYYRASELDAWRAGR